MARILADFAGVVDLLVYFWPVSVLVTGVALVALGMNFPTRAAGSFALFFVFFLFPPLCVLWGALSPHDDPFSSPRIWPLVILGVLLVVQMTVTINVIRRAKERRFLGTALGAAAGWLGIVSALIAAQGLTGDSL